MKKSPQVIRVSALRAREGAPSLSSWLDAVQVRACNNPVDGGPAPAAAEPRLPPPGGAGTAGLSDFVSFKIL
jgi:hypothetical protein